MVEAQVVAVVDEDGEAGEALLALEEAQGQVVGVLVAAQGAAQHGRGQQRGARGGQQVCVGEGGVGGVGVGREPGARVAAGAPAEAQLVSRVAQPVQQHAGRARGVARGTGEVAVVGGAVGGA